MAEPTINEIVSVPTETSRSPEVVPVYSNQAFLQGLNQQAQFKAENDWRKYNTFVNNLKDVYKNIDEIEAQEVMTEDRDILKKQAEDVFADILKNPNSIYSPELQQKIGKLRSDSTESKQNTLFDKANREFLARNPELNVEGNRRRVDEFRTKKLGERQPYNLEMPSIVDLDAIHGAIIKDPSVSQPWADSQVTDEFIVESSGTNYLRNPYLQAWNAALKTDQDKYGHYIKNYANQLYSQLPEGQRKKWDENGGVEAFWNSIGEQRFGSSEDIRTQNKENVQQNPNYLKSRTLDEDVRHHKAMEGVSWYNAKTARDNAKKDLEQTQTGNLQGNALNDIVIDSSVKAGEYDLDNNGENVANIQRLLGNQKDKYGRDIPILNEELLKLDKKGKNEKVKYKVDLIDGKPAVVALKVKGKWYDRGYFRNAQLNMDKEPLKGEKTMYEQDQKYINKTTKDPLNLGF